MRMKFPPVLAALLLLTFALPATAGSIAGRVTDGVGSCSEPPCPGSARANVEVRLWTLPDGKIWRPTSTVRTNASGAYQFSSLAAGRYLIDARLPNGVDGTVADRWVDTQGPTSNGWAGFAADVIDLEGSETLVEQDIVLLTQGGLYGTVNQPGVWVRFDNPAAPGFERVQQTMSDGRYSMNGLLFGDGFRVFVFDPTGNYEPYFDPGPFTVNYGELNPMDRITLGPRAPDPNEPNNDPTRGRYTVVDPNIFRADPPGVFISEGAFIGPIGEDLDTFCIEARTTDRFLAFTTTDLGIPGEVLDNPWVDPMLRFITTDGAVLDENDDAPGMGLNASVDSGSIQSNGTVCVQVTTYGDTRWNAASQQSAGDYTLIIEFGNRQPNITLRIAESVAPRPPGTAIVSEGTLLRIDIDALDPDGDDLTATVTHVDNRGTPVEDGTLDFAPDGRGAYTWTVPDDGSRHAPYEIDFEISDAEFTSVARLLVSPRNENIPPGPPELHSPEDGASVTSLTPILQVLNAEDPDGDPLTYEFEIHYGEPSTIPDETGHIPGDPAGTTSYTTRPIPENQRVSWRARALDGAITGGVSPWTEYWTFVVNAQNEAPLAPSLVKPDQGTTVPHASPALSASNAEDSDGDALGLVFEVATDADFEDIVRTSDPVAQNIPAGRTSWNVDPPLEWGTTYWARVHARDPQGAVSPFSNVREFRVKSNSRPEEPTLGGEFEGQCEGVIFQDVGPGSLTLPAVEDAEGEALTIDVQLFPDSADYENDTPLFEVSFEQPEGFDGEHEVPIVGVEYELNHRYVVRMRATDSEESTRWVMCSFWVRGDNEPPGQLTIISPAEGEVLPERTTAVNVVLGNAPDANGDPLTIHWCAHLVDDEAGCPASITNWQTLPQSTGEETEFTIEGVFRGADISLRVLACDPVDECGPESSTRFQIDKRPTSVTPSLCACDVVPGKRPDTAGWLLMWVAVFFAIRRRREA
jgi:MYXO-CTERM domain-containing protein